MMYSILPFIIDMESIYIILWKNLYPNIVLYLFCKALMTSFEPVPHVIETGNALDTFSSFLF